MIKVSEKYREYLVIYTTGYDDSYVLETIVADDVQILKETVKGSRRETGDEELAIWKNRC